MVAISFWLLRIIAPFLLFPGAPGSASGKVRFFKYLRFLLQLNKKLVFAKYHSRGGMSKE